MNVFDLEASLSLDTKDFEKAIKEIKRQSQELGKDLREQNKPFDDLQKEIEKLSAEVKKAGASVVNLGEKEEKTTEKTEDYTEATKEAREKSHSFEKSLDSLGSMASGVGGKIGHLAGAIKDTFVKAVEVGAAAVGAASTAVVALTKSAVSAYGSYEQLVGGSQKIFDEMNFSIIAKDAAAAYKDLNMSASEYLESINNVGASFTSTMGDEKAYETARKGMLAIADYASGTGRNLNELNQKYQMITRSTSSYQSIADQFSGILPATSADFLEQAQAAGLLSSEYTKLTEVPVAEYQKSVTEMLEKGVKELGLAKNAAKESTETLTGSFAMTKAAWSNLVVGLADPDADLGTLIGNFTDSAEASIKNLVPVVEQALDGISRLIEELSPKIKEKLPGLARSILPNVLLNGTKITLTLFNTIAKYVPEIAEYILPVLPELWNKLKSLGSLLFENVIKPAWKWVTQKLPGYINTELKKIDFKAIGKTMSDLIKEGLEGIADFVEAIDWGEVGRKIGDFIAGIDWGGILKAAFRAIVAAVKAAPDLIGGVIEAIGWEDAAAMAGVLFAPNLLKTIAGELGKTGAFDGIKKLLGEKTSEDAEGFGEMGFGSKFVLGIQSFLFGWKIGNWIREKWGDQIDQVLFEFFDKVDAFVSRAKKKIGKIKDAIGSALGIHDSFAVTEGLDPDSPEYKQAVKQEKLLTDWNLTLNGEENQKNFEKTWGLSSASAAAKTFTAATLVRDALDAAGKRPKYESFTPYAHAAGGIMINNPVLTTSGHLFGEAGREAILPLDHNTGWMDELGKRLGSNTNYITVNMEGMRIASDYDTDRFIERISEKLENLKVSDLRGVGGVRY